MVVQNRLEWHTKIWLLGILLDILDRSASTRENELYGVRPAMIQSSLRIHSA